MTLFTDNKHQMKTYMDLQMFWEFHSNDEKTGNVVMRRNVSSMPDYPSYVYGDILPDGTFKERGTMTDYDKIEAAVKMLTGEVAVLGQKVQDLSPMHPDIVALRKSMLDLNMNYVSLKNIVMDLNSRITKLEKEKEEDGTD